MPARLTPSCGTSAVGLVYFWLIKNSWNACLGSNCNDSSLIGIYLIFHIRMKNSLCYELKCYRAVLYFL